MKRKIKEIIMEKLKAAKIIQTSDHYNDECTVIKIKNGKQVEFDIEFVSRKVAVENELDFGSKDSRKEFVEYIAKQEKPMYIGAYKRLDTDLYYREL